MNAPTKKRILAVDFGERRIGLAATDFTGSITVPLPALIREDDRQSLSALADLAKDRQTEIVVFGMPLGTQGQVGPRAKRTEEYVQAFRKIAPCEVATIDETHTTDEAHDRLKAGGMKAAQRKQRADSVAAIIILERFLRR